MRERPRRDTYHGYHPDRLAARLFAVVDVWDAWRSDRPYRKGWRVEATIEYIRNQAGSHFDPKVVEHFLELIEPRNR